MVALPLDQTDRSDAQQANFPAAIAPPTPNPSVLQPLIVAGDPSGSPPDSPENRVDANVPTSPYAGVGSLEIFVSGLGGFLCSGILISPQHVLTAAHCLDVENEDGVLDVESANVTFNLNANGDFSQRITARDLVIYPEYTGFSNGVNEDLAIVTLSEPVPAGIPIYDLPTASQTFSEITMVGYGTTGNGIDGHIAGTASPTVKRVGKNVVDDASLFSFLIPDLDEIFLYDFDGPDTSTNTLAGLGSGLTLGNDIESTVGPGDSGGPSFVQMGDTLQLVGVNTFAFAFPNLEAPEEAIIQGTFGTGGGGVRITDPEKLAWINAQIAVAPVPTVGSLAGVQWQDLNGDRRQDAGEPGLADWTVYLDLNQNGRLDASEPSTLTDAAGRYELTDLAPGTYTVAAVPQPGWQPTFPTGGTATRLQADFSDARGEPSLDGFTLDNTGAAVPGLWHLSTGRGSQAGHSPDDSLYFGQGESSSGNGNYNVGHTAGRLTSPVIDLTGLSGATLSFNHFLNVEPGSEGDRAQVLIAKNGGAFEPVAAKGDGLSVMPSSRPSWQSISLDLKDFLGSQIQVQFAFDTVDSLFNSLEGWYVDDVRVSGSGSEQHTVVVEAGDAIAQVNFGRVPIANAVPPAPLLWRSNNGQNAYWELLAGNLVRAEFIDEVADPNWTVRAIGDLDGDVQSDDLLWQHRGSGQTAAWLLEDGALERGFFDFAAIASLNSPDWVIQGVGDFDGAGRLDDGVYRNAATGENAIATTASGETPQRQDFLTLTDANWDIGGVGSFDGDGATDDLVWHNAAMGEMAIWYMDNAQLGSGEFVEFGAAIADTLPGIAAGDRVRLLGDDWQLAGVSDLDADGVSSELLWRSDRLGQTVFWQMAGNEIVGTGEILPTVASGWTVITGATS